MKFGKKSASIAIHGGLAVSGLQFLLLLVLADKLARPDFDISGFVPVLLLLVPAGAAFAGFWLLRRSAELVYFALTVAGAVFLLVAGFIASGTAGAFVLPGGGAILFSSLMFLSAGEDPLPLWRRALVVLVGLIWLLFIVIVLYTAAYTLNIPGINAPGH